MVGRRARRWEENGTREEPDAPVICPLCERPIPPRARQSLHHPLPKLKGGARGETVRLHQICHSAIHARYSEAEIARRLADIAALRDDPELGRFLDWVRGKPDDFHAPTRMTRGRRSAKRCARVSREMRSEGAGRPDPEHVTRKRDPIRARGRATEPSGVDSCRFRPGSAPT